MAEPGSESPPSFEAALGRLEEIVSTLEGGEMPLEEALAVFEEGVRLSRFCHGKLQQAERRVEILLRGEDGEIEVQPFEQDVSQDQN
jgi:exodeoxyribonuclease VII small subunit